MCVYIYSVLEVWALKLTNSIVALWEMISICIYKSKLHRHYTYILMFALVTFVLLSSCSITLRPALIKQPVLVGFLFQEYVC